MACLSVSESALKRRMTPFASEGPKHDEWRELSQSSPGE